MEQPDGPALSIVVVTRDRYHTLRPIVDAFRRQTIAARLELVVVAPDLEAGTIPADEAAAFFASQVVAVGPIVNRGLAAAAGVRAARATIVALSENHCFPEPEWAERTLEAHQGSWTAVGPAVDNANPETSLSLTLHASGYGMFQPGGEPEERDQLPLHNSSYRRDALVAFGDDLDHLLSDERRLQRALLENGQALVFDPRPVKWHINEATWSLLAGLGYASGRRYGGTRATNWPFWKRLTYGLAFPLLSVPIAINLHGKLPKNGSATRHEPWLSLVIGFYAGIHAFGEAVSYLIGSVTEFPFVEDEEFLIRERLGNREIGDSDLAARVALLDDQTDALQGGAP